MLQRRRGVEVVHQHSTGSGDEEPQGHGADRAVSQEEGLPAAVHNPWCTCWQSFHMAKLHVTSAWHACHPAHERYQHAVPGPAPCIGTITSTLELPSLRAAGDLNIELHSDLAPRAAENFLVLADKGYYTGTKFHRSIKNFMVQVGSLCHCTRLDVSGIKRQSSDCCSDGA